MNPAERRQRRIVEGLRTQRQAVDAGPAIPGGRSGLDGAGIRLHRDLEVGNGCETVLDDTQQAGDIVGRKQAGRATAEKHAYQRPAGDTLGLLVEIPQQRLDVTTTRQAVAEGKRVEVTIRALPDAPRQVQVQGQRRQVCAHSRL